jgi:hypothetical protein
MNISIDYDGTITRAPEIFKDLCWKFIKQGDKVYIVTSRFEHELTDDIRLFEAQNGAKIICTKRKAKAKYMGNLGIKIDIWIDDNQAGIYQDVL